MILFWTNNKIIKQISTHKLRASKSIRIFVYCCISRDLGSDLDVAAWRFSR